MNLSTIITIAIALSFIYLAASFFTYAIQEQIVLFFNLKAENLKQTIYRLLGEEPPKKANNLKQTISNLLGEEPKKRETYTEQFYKKYLLSMDISLS
ncbi:MAG: hypothetical protein F6K24_36515 [Okeania sp. SIO2D1]|nr:hypothetical protein [Okeania sp. SIO2D1]